MMCEEAKVSNGTTGLIFATLLLELGVEDENEHLDCEECVDAWHASSPFISLSAS